MKLRKNAQSAHSSAKPPCGSHAQRLPRRANVPMTRRAGNTRLGTRSSVGGGRCPDIYDVARVRTMPSEQGESALDSSSGSELVSLSDRIMLLVACRPRARVVRACAVGVARWGDQMGRLGAPCKAGQRWCSLPHGRRCRRAPQFGAIGGPVGRAALRLETGRATCRS